MLPPVRQICPWANPEMQGAMGCDLVQLPRRDVWQMWRRGFCHAILSSQVTWCYGTTQESTGEIREDDPGRCSTRSHHLRRRLDGLRARWVGEGRRALLRVNGQRVPHQAKDGAFRVHGGSPRACREAYRNNAVVWGALLGACGLHSSLEHGMAAAESMHRLEEHHPAIYSMLLRIYGENGAWRTVDEVKETMEKVVVGKQRALSWVESAAASCGL
ncbi:unnamed protein product [Musa hybrid cultivar]